VVNLLVQYKPRPLLPELSGFFAGLTPIASLRSRLEKTAMRIEDETTEDLYELRAEIPGIDPSDVEITVQDGYLTIRAERTSKTESNGRSEFTYGAFERTVVLPAGANEDDITASSENGILTVSVPLSESKRIAVEDNDVEVTDIEVEVTEVEVTEVADTEAVDAEPTQTETTD
jgi:HSP20 family protein